MKDVEKKELWDEKVSVLCILGFSTILLLLVKDQVKCGVFIHSTYSTFLIAMGIIVFNITNLNKDRTSEIIGLIFGITGIMEVAYIFRLITYGHYSYMLDNLTIIISGVVDIFPIIGIYLAFRLSKKDTNVFFIVFRVLFGVVAVVSSIVLSATLLSKTSITNFRWALSFEGIVFIISLSVIIISLTLYASIKKNNYDLDACEKKLLTKILVITIIASFPKLLHFVIGNFYLEDLISQIITNLAIYYLYQYIIQTNVRKTYKMLNETNEELLIKTEGLKEKNKKLLHETDKIGELKEVLTIKEKKLQSTLNASVNSIVVFNNKKEITYVNNAFKYCFSDDEHKLSYNIDDDLKPNLKNYDDLIVNIEKVFETKANSNEFIYTNDGRIYQAIFAPLVINQEIQGALCILIDKTKKKEFEEKIIEANQRYESFLESIGDGIVVLEGEKRVYVNKACKDIFKQDIDSINFSENCDKNNVESEYIVNGEKIYVEKRFSRYTKNGKNKTIIVIRDITSRKKAQMKLKDSQKSYARFIDILPDGICLIDKELNIYYANKSLLDMLEISSIKDIKNTNVKNIINLTLEEKDVFDKNMMEVLEKNRYIYLLEHEFVATTNKKVQVEVNALPFSIENNKYIMLITKDLTHKKTSEMAEKELLERLKTDKIKTEFFANMSHELKTPLNVISSSNQLVDSFYKSGKIEDFNSNVKSHIELVRQSSYRLQRLINNIIDLTKMESGFYNLKLDKHNIVEVIEDLIGYVTDYATRKDIDLIFDTELEEIYVYIDKQEIERVMLNLLSNCIKFTENGGNIYLNIYTKDQEVFISVKDNGVGIPKNKLELIFEEFAQVDKTLSRNTEGSGIGLTIVKNLVELHGGNIKVISKVNVGTEFIISIPIKNLNYEDCQQNKGIYNIEEKVKIEFSDIYY